MKQNEVTAEPTLGGELKLYLAPEHGLIKISVKRPLDIGPTEVVFPIDQFFAQVGETLHIAMKHNMEARTQMMRAIAGNQLAGKA